jgi:DNA-binding transcriptional ArsR family regulator
MTSEKIYIDDDDFDDDDEGTLAPDERRDALCIRPWHHGYIEVKLGDMPEDIELRKVTPHQRKMAILYYIKTHNGKKIFFGDDFAKLMGTEQRTIQYDIKSLIKEGMVRMEPTFDRKGRSSHNRYFYEVRKESVDHFFAMKPSIERIYSKENYLGLRNWHWEDYKVIFGMEDDYHTKRDKMRNFEELTEKRTEIWKTIRAYDSRKIPTIAKPKKAK